MTGGAGFIGSNLVDTLIARGDEVVVLDGNSGRDHVTGAGGDDRLEGGSGNDILSAGSGRDIVEGESGNDRILARDNARDRIRCGRGRDSVQADRVDKIARRGAQRCERVTYPRRR